MKYMISVVLTAVLLVGFGYAGDAPEIKSQKEKINYSIGYQIGGDFKRQGVDLDPVSYTHLTLPTTPYV